MSRFLLPFLLLIGRFGLMAQTVRFNFSAASVSVPGWINMSGDPSLGVVSATDPTTGISLTSIATANWIPLSGTGCAYNGTGMSNGTFFPAAVMVNHWFQYGPTAVFNPSVPQLKISGLNPNAIYSIRMTGSNSTSFNLNPSRFTVAGRIDYGYSDVNSNANTYSGAIFNNITPDSSGALSVYINTVSGTEAADICGLQVTLANPPLTFSDGLTRTGNNVVFGGSTQKVGSFTSTSYPRLMTNFSWASPNMMLQTMDTTNAHDDELHLYPEAFQVGLSSGSPTSPSTLHRTYYGMFCGNYQPSISMFASDGTNSQSFALNQYDITLPMFANTLTLDSLLTTDHSGNLIFVPGVAHSGWSLGGNAGINPSSQYIGTTDAQPLAFHTNGVERLRVDTSGNVGIGTLTPQSRLAVNGTVTAKVVKVTPTGWSDYVFDSSYHLAPLTEVDRYIRIHKHLPDIVSAAQVRQQGLDLGESQAAQLKKIEELTLYVIELNKKVAVLAKENRQLKKMISRAIKTK